MGIMKFPSIFNDVIGPIMRGPSSSHCAASVRIGKMARDLMGGNIQEILIEFDTNGSLATTHESQGSDMGLYGGLLGWEADDERLTNYSKAVEDAGIKISIDIKDLGYIHPNTYKLSLKNNKEQHQLVAISAGGGMIEIIEIDGIKVSLMGDYFETLIFSSDPNLQSYLQDSNIADEILVNEYRGNTIFELKSSNFLEKGVKDDIVNRF